MNGGYGKYAWYKNGVVVVSADSTSYYSYTPTVAKLDTIKCVLTSSASCVTTPTATSNSIIINTAAKATPIVSVATSTPSNCIGSSVTFKATSANGGYGKYAWYKNGVVVVSVDSTSYYTYTPTVAKLDTIKCVLTSSSSCVTSSTATSNIAIVSTTTKVAPSVSISTNAYSSCLGRSYTFKAASVNGGTAKYAWYKNGVVVVSLDTTGLFTYTPTVAKLDTIKCVLTSSASCLTATTATSNSIIVSTTATVTPSVSIATNTTSNCLGGSITFKATSVNGGYGKYAWYKNGVVVISADSTSYYTYTPTVAKLDTFKCVLTSSASCVTSSTAISNNLIISTTDKVAPSVSITTSSYFACLGSNITLKATPINGGSAKYAWYKNGAVAVTYDTLGSYTYSPTIANTVDSIKCVLTSSANCVTTNVATSSVIGVFAAPAVTPSVSISATATSITKLTKVTFTATVVNGGNATIYQWKKNGINVGTNKSTYIDSSLVNSDIISCTITSNATCLTTNTASSSNIKMIVTGSNPIVKANLTSEIDAMQVRLFPNPSYSGNAILEVSGVTSDVNVAITDFLGRIVSKYTFNKDSKVSLPNNIAGGTYIVSIINGKEIKYLKWINIK